MDLPSSNAAFYNFVDPLLTPQYDVDYVEIIGRPEFLKSVSLLEFNIGPYKRPYVKEDQKYVLVAYNPGFVYVSLAKIDKLAFVTAISDQFGYKIEASNDPTVLLKALNRRMASSTLVRLLEVQNVDEVVYLNYGMKAPISDYAFLDQVGASDAVQEIIVDIGVNDTITGLGSAMLSQTKPNPTDEYRFIDYELFSIIQARRYPMGRPYGTTTVIASDSESSVLMARIYSNIIHVIKANVQAYFPGAPRTVRALRRYEQYYANIQDVFLRDNRGCKEIRTELRMRKGHRTMDNLITAFETERNKIYDNMNFRGLHIPTTMLLAKHLVGMAKREMKVFSGSNDRALRRNQVLMYHVLNNSHGVVAQNGNRCISIARHLLSDVFHGRVPAQARVDEADEETKGDVPMDDVELVSDIVAREIREFAEGPDTTFELAVAADNDDASEEEQERLRRFAPADPSSLPDDVEYNVLIKIEGPRKQRYHVVRKVDGSIWRRSTSREALIEMIIAELGVEWREFVQSKY